jgi:phage terminase small subunit
MKLTPKQELFVNEYCIDCNATQAAIRAGYKEKAAYATGAENLRKPQIKVLIDKAMKERAENNGITAEFVLKGIKGIATKGEKESDQLKAYELLGKHLKLFTEKIESENTNYNVNIVDDIK